MQNNNYLTILNNLSEKSQKSLSDENLNWICELIKKYQPKRILEIGVSTGGSTAVYLNCLQSLGLKSELISVDSEIIATYKKGQPTIGAEIDELSPFLNLTNFKLIKGKYICEVVNEIGTFDMIIMDTVHFIPGEVLDLLYLKNNIHQNTILIFDDINIESRYPEIYSQNLNSSSSNPMILAALSGKLLFPNTILPEIGGIILKEFDENRLLLCLCHKWNSDILECKNYYFTKIAEIYGSEFLGKLETIYNNYKYSNFNKEGVLK